MIKITMKMSIIITTVIITTIVTIQRSTILIKIITTITQPWQDEAPGKISPKEKTNVKKAYHLTIKTPMKTTIIREKQLNLILRQITQDLNLDACRLPCKSVKNYQSLLIQN